MFTLALIMLFLWVLVTCLTLLGTAVALTRLNSNPPYWEGACHSPPVSILKPLKGVDRGIRKNIESFFNLQHPQYELIFSAANEDDPVCTTVQELMATHPNVSAQLIIGDTNAGPNPKINNLMKSYELAKHELILISDSNVRVRPDYLDRQLAHFDHQVGIVTAVVAGRNGKGLGGQLEAMQLNTFYTRWIHLLFLFKNPCVIGKSMLFSRKEAERFGGIKTLARYLAEDYMAGQAMRMLGLKIVLMSDPIEQHVGQKTFKDYWFRHVRWGRIRKAQAPLAFCFEPLVSPLLVGSCGAIAFLNFFAVPPIVFFASYFAVLLMSDTLLFRKLEPNVRMQTVLIWCLKELFCLPLWLHIAIGNSVVWRGKKYRVLPGGLLE
ncbi:MAG: glycosyltransferase [Deltaproteobacteria bacterium]|nr:glycosyltransferase [Deltaproteobacteria bacterium]